MFSKITGTTFFMFRPMQQLRNWFYGTDTPLIEVLDEDGVKNVTSKQPPEVKEEFSEAVFNCSAQHNILDPVTCSLIAMN